MSRTSINLGWPAVPGATGYKVARNGTVVTSTKTATTARGLQVATGDTITVTATIPASPPSTGQPANFTLGPLGTNNLLPTGPGAFLSAQFGGIGYSKQQQRAQIASRQAAMGRVYDVIQDHYDGGGTFGGVWGCEDPTAYSPTCEQFAAQNGSESAIVWTPNLGIPAINTGAADAIWSKMAHYWAALAPQRIMLRAFHEYNLPGFAWGLGNPASGNYTAADFQLAWKRMVNIIHPIAPNVGFWFCPFEGGEQGGTVGRQFIADSYPGVAFVDWIGSDVYNVPPGYSTPLHAGWASFREIFNYDALGSSLQSVYSLSVSLGKPFVVGETGTLPGATGEKGQWFGEIPAALANMPNCKGVSFFDADTDHDYRVDQPASDPSNLAGFGAMAKTPAFQGRA